VWGGDVDDSVVLGIAISTVGAMEKENRGKEGSRVKSRRKRVTQRAIRIEGHVIMLGLGI
jgi:hypothetical protein